MLMRRDVHVFRKALDLEVECERKRSQEVHGRSRFAEQSMKLRLSIEDNVLC